MRLPVAISPAKGTISRSITHLAYLNLPKAPALPIYGLGKTWRREYCGFTREEIVIYRAFAEVVFSQARRKSPLTLVSLCENHGKKNAMKE
jgi:hypothetical protein